MRYSVGAAVVVALTITLAPVFAADSSYKLDAKGNCHDSSGKFAAKTLCAASAHTYKLDAKGGCHDETGKFAKKDLCKS